MKEPSFFECCSDPHHIMRIRISESFGDIFPPELVVENQLSPRHNLFVRAWKAIKYFLGISEPYGHWDCMTLNEKDVVRLRALCDEYFDQHKEWEEKFLEDYGEQV